MDLCQCLKPVINSTKHKDPFCETCGLWFVKESWEKDSRVTTARKMDAKEYPPANTMRVPFPTKPDLYAPCKCGCGKKIKFCPNKINL